MNKGNIFVRENINEKKKVAPSSATKKAVFQDTREQDESDDDAVHYRSNMANPYNASYEEIYQFLLSLLNGNELTLKEILQLAKVMFKEGVRTPEMASIKIKKDKKTEVNIENISEKQVRSR